MSEAVDLDRSISPDQTVAARQVGDELVMLHLGTGIYFSLDPVGARAWQLFGNGNSLKNVCDVMLDEYDVSRSTLERDLEALVEQLTANGLVVVTTNRR